MLLPLTRRRKKEVASLTRKKHRDRLGQTLLEGVRSVSAAIDADAPLTEILVTPEAFSDAEIAALLSRSSIPIHQIEARDLRRLSAVENSQGVLAVATARYLEPADIACSRQVIVLDGVQDPGNAGAVIRAAAWFGVEAVLTGPGTVDLYHPKVVRAAMGALWDVQVARSDDLPASFDMLRENGFRFYGADLSGTEASSWKPADPGVLVLGSEGHGMSDAVAAQLDERVVLPGAGGRRATESLNVAVAAGILLYEWLGRVR